MGRSHNRLPALAAALLMAGAACATNGDDQTRAADDDPANDGPAEVGDDPGQPADDEPVGRGEVPLDWEPCGPGECTLFEVPLDYDDPDGDRLSLSVARMRAPDDDRIGALFVNPGGPGGTASDFAIALALSLPEEITDRFDIVGVDPRGVGTEGTTVDCSGDLTGLYGVDHTPESEEGERILLEASEDYVIGCDREAGDLLPHLGTRNVARDIDALRAALGDEQISYLGYSYGTVIGQVYADLFPNRVRAMVLDGVVELGPSGTDLAREQALGFERALASFADDCDTGSGCPLAPNTIDAVGQLIDHVKAAPIPASPRDLGPGELAFGLALPLYTSGRWPALADAVAEALDGDGSRMVGLADEYLSLADFDVYFAVNCLDFAWPDEPEELLDDGAAAAQDAPHFGAAIVNDYVRCSMWPAEAEPLSEISAPGSPPILVVSTTNDPATPYQAGVNVAERLESGVLLTHGGEGHGVVGLGLSCIDDAVVEYLVNLDPPEDGTTC